MDRDILHLNNSYRKINFEQKHLNVGLEWVLGSALTGIVLITVPLLTHGVCLNGWVAGASGITFKLIRCTLIRQGYNITQCILTCALRV